MGMRKILVHRGIVDHNTNTGDSDPVFTVIAADGTEYHTSSITILGPCEIKYDRDGPEGMRVWIETFDKVIAKDGTDTESGRPIMASI